MQTDHPETRALFDHLIKSHGYNVGFDYLINTNEFRYKIISTYLTELDSVDNVFEVIEPSRFLISRFILNPEYVAYDMMDDIVDSAVHSHRSRLEEMFDEEMAHYDFEVNGKESEMREHIDSDNRERFLDLKSVA